MIQIHMFGTIQYIYRECESWIIYIYGQPYTQPSHLILCSIVLYALVLYIEDDLTLIYSKKVTLFHCVLCILVCELVVRCEK